MLSFMTEARIDIEKLATDIEAADAEVAELAEQMRSLSSVHDAAFQKVQRLRELQAMMTTYLIRSEDETEILTSEFAGLPATKAIEKLFELYPNDTLRLDMVFEMLTERGWQGELNAVQVAASRLTKRGVLDRPQPSQYRLAQPSEYPWELEDGPDEVDGTTEAEDPP